MLCGREMICVFPGCRAQRAPGSGHAVLLCRWKKALAAVSRTVRSRSSSIWFGELHDGGGAVGVEEGLQDVLELLVA